MRLEQRVPEPELMEGPEQARAYSEADFSDAHDAFVALLVERVPAVVAARRLVDLGCGPADVTARLAGALPLAAVVGIDGGARMLALGRERLERMGLTGRVELRSMHLPAEPADLAALGPFDVVASNSLLHHLDDPATLWTTVRALSTPGTVVHVGDLLRPVDDATVDELVARHAQGAPAVLVEDFRCSLRAAYRPDEVRDQLIRAGLDDVLEVSAVSDRHLLVHGRLR